MRTTLKSIILVIVIFTVLEVKCGDITFEILKPDMKVLGIEVKEDWILITHGKLILKNVEVGYFDDSKFYCLDENQTLSLKIHTLSSKSYDIKVNKSFDFGKYEVHDPSNSILNLKENKKVCFFTGYFLNEEAFPLNRAELYLKFINDERKFDFNKILSMFVNITPVLNRAFLYSINKEYTDNYLKILQDISSDSLGIETSDRDNNIKDVKINLNNQVFAFEGFGKFRIYFTHPNYLFDTKNLEIYRGKRSGSTGLIELKCQKNEVNIMIPKLKSDVKQII